MMGQGKGEKVWPHNYNLMLQDRCLVELRLPLEVFPGSAGS